MASTDDGTDRPAWLGPDDHWVPGAAASDPDPPGFVAPEDGEIDRIESEMRAVHADAESFARRLVGLPRSHAEELASSTRFSVLFIRPDLPTTADFRPSRIVARVEDDVVVSARAG